MVYGVIIVCAGLADPNICQPSLGYGAYHLMRPFETVEECEEAALIVKDTIPHGANDSYQIICTEAEEKGQAI